MVSFDANELHIYMYKNDQIGALSIVDLLNGTYYIISSPVLSKA
jgi:hypothetical protein